MSSPVTSVWQESTIPSGRILLTMRLGPQQRRRRQSNRSSSAFSPLPKKAENKEQEHGEEEKGGLDESVMAADSLVCRNRSWSKDFDRDWTIHPLKGPD